MPNFDSDFEARKRIEKEIYTNFFVEAGAGSGKTTELVRRLIAMVEQGLDISKICAITFTKAAAGEFYARFQKGLSESESPYAKEALKNIDLCFMGTIDAFCNMILSEHPSAARVPSDATIVDEDELKELYRQEFRKIAHGERGDDLRKKCIRFKKYNTRAEDLFVNSNALAFLRSSRNADFVYKKVTDKSANEYFVKERALLGDIFAYLKKHPELEDTSRKDSVAAWQRLSQEHEPFKASWDEDLNSVIYLLKDLKNIRIIKEFNIDTLGLNANKIFEPKLDKKGQIKFWHVKEDGDPLGLQKIQDYIFDISLDFIHDTVDVVSENLRAQGKLDFFDCLLYLRDLLKEDAKKDGALIKHIYERHSYFLIDEFQDTNPIQAEVFFYLAAKNPVEDWTACIPKPGSLFFVGDPKQSIYRFRYADVSSYMKVKNLFYGEVGEVLELARNFRSTDTMCAWFNKAFCGLMPEDSSIQSKYSSIPLGEKNVDKSKIQGAYLYRFNSKVKNIESPEWDMLSRMIRSMVDQKDNTIFHKNKNIKNISYKDIMVITPKKGRLSYIMKSFLQWGIPFTVEGKVMFDECPALYALSAVLKAVSRPNDKSALLFATCVSGLKISENEILDLSKQFVDSCPSSCFAKLMSCLELFAKVDSKNAEHLYFAQELLRTKEISGEIVSLEEAACFIESLVCGSNKDLERVFKLHQDSNCVKIANLHKVKGLEAPVVILADPKDSKPNIESCVEYAQNTTKSYLFKLSKGGEAGNSWSLESQNHPEKKELEEDILAAEKIRLLYVAATRAENALFVADSWTKSGRSAKNPWLPLLSYIDADVCDVLDINNVHKPECAAAKSARSLYDDSKKHSVLNDQTSQNKTYYLVRPSEEKLRNKYQADEQGELSVGGSFKKDPALVGTLVHRLLECIVSASFNYEINSLVCQILSEYGLDDKYYENLLFAVDNQMNNGGYDQAGEHSSDLFAALCYAKEIYCELPFSYREDDNIYNGVIDLVYLDEEGWHIVDYKTNFEATNLKEIYQGQLLAYQKAFKLLAKHETTVNIYHIQV